MSSTDSKPALSKPSSIDSVEALESVVGPVPPIMKSKSVRTLDVNCSTILSLSSFAGLGFRDESGPRTALVGGTRGFARAETSRRICFALPDVLPLDGEGASLIFLIAGVGETLRVNGTLTTRAGQAIFHVDEAFVHCALSILRSRLWSGPKRTTPLDSTRQFIEASPFLFLSSWAADGSSDTSPRGDPPGVLRMLDERTLALPDRRGNRRTDTLHNVMGDPRVALLALVPGTDQVLEVVASSQVVTEPTLLASFANGARAPMTAMILRVERAEMRASPVLQSARPWDVSTHLSRDEAPNMMGLAAAMVANQRRWVGLLTHPFLQALMWLTRPLTAILYRKGLRDEGHDVTRENSRAQTRARRQ